MNRFLAVFLLALITTPVLAGTIRTIDFENPAPYANFWEHPWEAYPGYEATFEYGIRKVPAGDGTTSTMYWGGAGVCGNCDSGPIRIFFSKPVKNIHFTLFDYFSSYSGPIHWDTREFFTGPPATGMSIIPSMISREFRSITIPAEHVRYLDIATGHDVAIDDFSFEVEGDAQNAMTYRLDLNEYTDPQLRPVDGKTITPGTDINAQLALGTIFSVGISKRTPDPFGGPATITSVASTYTRSADKVMPALETAVNLFPAGPVVQVESDPTTAVTELKYAAVHLGTVKFTMTPFGVGAPSSVTLNLTIVRPSALGGDHNDWDERVIDAAHERGIPPQILKGQIRQESPSFSKDELRYEPCSWDFASISRGAALINKLPYSLYALDGALADQGFSDTVDLRNRYLIDTGGVTRFLSHSDTQISTRAIWEANDGPLTQQGYDLGAEDQNWSQIPCAARKIYLKTHTMAQFMTELGSFLAQPPTASSYGVMQVMYGTAVQPPIGWYVPNPGRNLPGCPTTTDKCQTPRYLRDTPESLALTHGGSIFSGSHQDVQLYWDWGPSTPAFTSQDDFFDSFEDPLRHYTGGGIPNYGKNIIDSYQYDFLPVQPVTIFP